MMEVLTPYDLEAYVGKKLGTSQWLIIDQQRIDDFARVSGDDNWIHVDVERARRELRTLEKDELIDGGVRLTFGNIMEIEHVERPALVAETISIIYA